MNINSIRYKFILIYAIVAAFTISSVGMFFYYYVSDKMIESTYTDSMHTTEHYAEDIGDLLYNHISVLTTIAQEEDVQSMDESAIFKWIELLRSSDSYLFLNNAYGDREGYARTPGFDPWYVGDREPFKKQLAGNIDYNVGGPLYGEALGLPIITISVPIKDTRGMGIGTFSGSIPLDSLLDEINDMGLAESSYAWICDEKGNLIVHPVFGFQDYVNLADLVENGYENTDALMETMTNNDSGRGEYYDRNTATTRIVTFDKIPYTNGWIFGITTIQDDMLLQARDISKVIGYIAIVTLIFVMFITGILTNTIIGPIVRLTKAVNQTRELKPESVRYSNWYNEINELIKSYNVMTHNMNRSKESLEVKVKERTQELEAANMALYEMAIYDRLTKAYNRGKIFDELNVLQEEVDLGNLDGFTIIFMDLDNFKKYNDRFGHDIGDNILKHLVLLLIAVLGERGMIGRYGGDEFVIILPGLKLEVAKSLGQELTEALDELRGYESKVREWTGVKDIKIPIDERIGLSMGYASYYKGCGVSIKNLIRNADMEMFDRKLKKKQHRC